MGNRINITSGWGDLERRYGREQKGSGGSRIERERIRRGN